MDNQNENEREYNSNLSGGQPGIYGTPGLTVNPENVVLTREAVSDSNKERVAAAFTQTGASNRARAIARANQVVRVSVPFPSTITGDIQLQPNTRRKRKTPFVLITIVAIIAALGGVIYGVTRRNSENNLPISVATVENSSEQFDRFATYILYGGGSQ